MGVFESKILLRANGLRSRGSNKDWSEAGYTVIIVINCNIATVINTKFKGWDV
jgi:hypothetical protein